MQNTMSEIPNPSEMASSLIHKHGKQLAMRLAMEETIKAQGKTIIIPSVSGETWSVFWEINELITAPIPRNLEWAVSDPNEKRSHQLPDRTASLKNSFISLARSLGTFRVPKSQYPWRRASIPKLGLILLAENKCHNRNSIHNPVEHGDKHPGATM